MIIIIIYLFILYFLFSFSKKISFFSHFPCRWKIFFTILNCPQLADQHATYSDKVLVGAIHYLISLHAANPVQAHALIIHTVAIRSNVCHNEWNRLAPKRIDIDALDLSTRYQMTVDWACILLMLLGLGSDAPPPWLRFNGKLLHASYAAALEGNQHSPLTHEGGGKALRGAAEAVAAASSFSPGFAGRNNILAYILNDGKLAAQYCMTRELLAKCGRENEMPGHLAELTLEDKKADKP